MVLDQAEQKGTGRWTVQSALDLGIPITGIAEATFARSLSGHADQREAARAAFADAGEKWQVDDRDAFVEDVRRALYASKIVAYAQGFDHIARRQRRSTTGASTWACMATIWRGGCIIRARFLDRIREAYDAEPELPSLLVAPYFADRPSADGVHGLAAGGGRRGREAGIPTPAFSSSLAYFDGLRRGPAARRADPGPAGQLRRAHLPPGGPAGHVPHRVGGRPARAPGLSRRAGRLRAGQRAACGGPRPASPGLACNRRAGPGADSPRSARSLVSWRACIHRLPGRVAARGSP